MKDYLWLFITLILVGVCMVAGALVFRKRLPARASIVLILVGVAMAAFCACLSLCIGLFMR